MGNKSDDYENEDVKDGEAKEFAKSIRAIFKKTSAKLGNGIDELFKIIGKQYLNPELSIYSNLTKEEQIKYEDKIKIEKIKSQNKNNKKRCCKWNIFVFIFCIK